MDLELIRWRDAFFTFALGSAEELREEYEVITIGFVIADGPLFISVAQEILPDGDGYRGVTSIPRALINPDGGRVTLREEYE